MRKLPEAQTGICILIYSEFGWGKTFAYSTLPGKTKLISTERRDPRISLKGHDENIDYSIPDSYYDLMEWLNHANAGCESGEFPFQNVGLDSASFLMSSFKLAIEDDRLTERVESDKAKYDNLIDIGTLIDKDWGGLASMMKRITHSFTRLSQFGVNVIFTATEVAAPKWDLSLRGAPSFLGREFPAVLNGYFDFMGRIVEPWKIKENGSISPPTISFVSEKGDYVAKCCSSKLAAKGNGPLNYAKIFEIINS